MFNKKLSILLTLLLLTNSSTQKVEKRIDMNFIPIRFESGLNIKRFPEHEIKDINELKKYIYDTVSDSNKEFTKVLDEYRISSTVWKYKKYKNQGFHLGNDYETAKGANIYAPLSGYIIKADGSYDRNGYLGCSDGKFLNGGGNEIYMIAELNDKIYGFIFMHCLEVKVKEKDFVNQGSIIATVGKTGDAASYHLHLEMYYLGDGNLSEYIDIDYPVDFGVGRDYQAYKNRCIKKGTYPCILDSREYILDN